jgi:hypothetical protein
MKRMERHLDLERYPLHDLQGARGKALVEQCKLDLAERGMFNLPGFLRSDALARSLSELRPLFDDRAFLHKRSHNIYFAEDIAGLAPDHPALRRLFARTSSRRALSVRSTSGRRSPGSSPRCWTSRGSTP